MKDIITLILVFIFFTGLLTIVIKFVTEKSKSYYNNNGKIIKSPKPITPELQITGNGINMDTVYIYRLEE